MPFLLKAATVTPTPEASPTPSEQILAPDPLSHRPRDPRTRCHNVVLGPQCARSTVAPDHDMAKTELPTCQVGSGFRYASYAGIFVGHGCGGIGLRRVAERATYYVGKNISGHRLEGVLWSKGSFVNAVIFLGAMPRAPTSETEST
jgi:hypothetical protein